MRNEHPLSDISGIKPSRGASDRFYIRYGEYTIFDVAWLRRYARENIYICRRYIHTDTAKLRTDRNYIGFDLQRRSVESARRYIIIRQLYDYYQAT